MVWIIGAICMIFFGAALVAIGLSVTMWGYAIAGVVLAAGYSCCGQCGNPVETGRGFVKRLGVPQVWWLASTRRRRRANDGWDAPRDCPGRSGPVSESCHAYTAAAVRARHIGPCRPRCRRLLGEAVCVHQSPLGIVAGRCGRRSSKQAGSN